MKRVSLVSALLMFSLFSCEKSENESSNGSGTQGAVVSSPLAKEKDGKLCVQNNINTLTNSNGEWSCPSPAKDCGKISPCSTVKGGGSQVEKLNVSDLAELDAAIAKGILTDYISTPEGANLIKRLLGGKGSLFSRIATGELTIVKKESRATGNAYYLVVDVKLPADKISVEDVHAAFEYAVK